MTQHTIAFLRSIAKKRSTGWKVMTPNGIEVTYKMKGGMEGDATSSSALAAHVVYANPEVTFGFKLEGDKPENGTVAGRQVAEFIHPAGAADAFAKMEARAAEHVATRDTIGSPHTNGLAVKD